MFPALKYLAIDYLYEKMTMQKISLQSLSVYTPSCLYKNIKYSHDGGFADDKYRTPWTRVSADATQILTNFSALDHWKKTLCIEDFLEKKPILSSLSRIYNEDIILSSNPDSQLDIEDGLILISSDKNEEFSYSSYLQLNYVPVVLKQPKEGLYIEDELVFMDSLTQYTKRLPTLHTLLSRLNILHVEDPFLTCKGNSIREENIFRECFTFEIHVTTEAKKKEVHEDFHQVFLMNDEALVLPIQLESSKTTNLMLNTEIPTSLTLKSLLQITLEVIDNEDESFKISSQNLKMKIIPEKKSSEHCSSEDICDSESQSALEFNEPAANYISVHPGELEVPLTPPNKSRKLYANSLYSQVHLEPLSPFTKSDLITKSMTEYFESLVWQSEKYHDAMSSLLLAEHHNFVHKCQQITVTELKTLLSVHEDICMIGPSEKDVETNIKEIGLETLSIDLNGEERFVWSNQETFSRASASQLEGCLEEENAFANNRVECFGVPHFSGTKDSCSVPKEKDILLPLPFGAASERHLQNRAEQTGTTIENNAVTEKHIRENESSSMCFRNHEEKKANCREVSVEPKISLGNKKPVSFELARKHMDDFDLLSNFIMLRSQHLITEREEVRNEDIQKVLNVEEENPTLHSQASPVALNATVPTETQTKENEDVVSLQVKASENQFHAYRILEVAVDPILKDLMNLGVCNWTFATLNFDVTRFFLKQQEKVISDAFNQDVTGTKDARDATIFRHAVVLHLLVTVRDLLLTCNLNTALEYLSKTKGRYKDFLNSSLDNVWRMLKIVQVALQKQETNPKITELYCQMSKWVQNNNNDQNKAVIVIRLHFDEETSILIDTINKVQGLETMYLNSEKRGTLLMSKTIIQSLERCSCIIIHSQHIGPDFPWTYFSLIVEYNYSENSSWIGLCKSLHISYVTLTTALPETAGNGDISQDNFGCALLAVQIPYVFLTSEGLLSTPEILQLLESKYNITFIERSSCEVLQFFGNTDSYVVMTIDECTAIIMQNIEGLNYEKSSDNMVLRLVVLSLQYSSCWIIFYSKERLNSEYSLSGKTLHHLALIYAALVQFSQKSEDFEVKVALSPGVEETGLLIRQIADHILMTSKRNPQEWLDRSWLSVLPSEGENCLLTFPCVNPLVAQVMLMKSSSLEWLLSATFEELHTLFPEVPDKVLKQFSDITSLYALKSPAASKPPNEAMRPSFQSFLPEGLPYSFQRSNNCIKYPGDLDKGYSKRCSPDYSESESNGKYILIAPPVLYQGEACYFHDSTGVKKHLPFLKDTGTERRSSLLPAQKSQGFPYTDFDATVLYIQDGTETNLESDSQNFTCILEETRQKQDTQLLKNPTNRDVKNVFGMKKQAPVPLHNSNPESKRSWYLVSKKEQLPFHQNSARSVEEFNGISRHGNPECHFEDTFWSSRSPMQMMKSPPHDSGFCNAASSPDRFFSFEFDVTGEYMEKKCPNLLLANHKEGSVSPDSGFMTLPQHKKRRLTFEKDPERRDGQTRLKFF